MRSRLLVVAAVLFLSASSQAAFAEQPSGQGPGPKIENGAGKTTTPEQFPEKKARILKTIDERRARLDQAKACVEAAKTDEDLAKCRPEPPMGGGMRHWGPGQQRPPMPPAGGTQQTPPAGGSQK